MSVARHHLAWFKLKCPYPIESKDYKEAYVRLQNATYSDLERLRAEFDEYDDGSIPVRHYKHKGQWYAKPVSGGTAQKLNMKGIQQHGKKWRVQQRRDGRLKRWTYDTFEEAQTKRDKVFEQAEVKMNTRQISLKMEKSCTDLLHFQYLQAPNQYQLAQ